MYNKLFYMINNYKFLNRFLLIFSLFILPISYNVFAQEDTDTHHSSIDLDDDNDGILDTDECYYGDLLSSEGSSWSIYGSTRGYDGTTSGGNSWYNIVAGEVYVKTAFFTDNDGNVYDLAMDYVGFGSTSGSLSGTVSLFSNNFSLRNGDPSNNEYFEMRMYFVLSGDDPTDTANHITIDQATWTLRDIDNSAITNYSEIAGFPGVPNTCLLYTSDAADD